VGLDRVRDAARKNGDLKFTALLHHADVDALRRSFFKLKRTAAVGIDGVTWQGYEQALEENLIDLHGRIHRGSYRAKPALRRYINKPDGRKRALGIAVLEDKIVQHAVSEILQNVHEPDFLGFSYGFRKGKSQHNALDALYMGISHKKVNWILDADIEGFFDTIDHEWLIKFLEHRIGDRRILRFKEIIQCFGLCCSPWKTVENKAFGIRMPIHLGFEHLDGHLVRYECAFIYIAFRQISKLRMLLDISAKNVTR
jgi:hypothetical protein